MKVLGFALIAIGILMLVFRGFSFTQEKKSLILAPLKSTQSKRNL